MDKQSENGSTSSQSRNVITLLGGTAIVVVIAEVVLLLKTPARSPGDTRPEVCLGPGSCGKMENILPIFLNTSINRRFDRLIADEENRQSETKTIIALKNVLKTTYWRMAPAARVIGDHNIKGQAICGNSLMCKDDLQPILHWTHTGSARDYSVYLRHGLKYRDGRLVVPVDGKYYVYSYLDMYEPVHVTSGNKRCPPLQHAIYRFNILEDAEEQLLVTSHTHRDSGMPDYNRYNSRLESIVRLKAGDELSVKVSNVSYLVYPSSNYFGVNMF